MSDANVDPRKLGRPPPPPERQTPFLELDADRLERNLLAMQRRADGARVCLRPHIKTHKSLRIARRQIALGASGVTASKPSEAQVFVEGGIASVTLAYPVVRSAAIDYLLEVGRARGADLNFIAADWAGVAALAEAGLRHGLRLSVFLKVDVGLGRVGVKPDAEDAVHLAAALSDGRDLSMAGLLAHAGHAYGASDISAIREIATKEAADLTRLKARLEAAGIAVPCVSVGSTPTCLGAPIPPGVDEIRPGNYAFLDRTAMRLGLCEPDDLTLSVVATVVARNSRYAIIDAGSKALSSDQGPHGTSLSGFGAVVIAERAPEAAWQIEKMSEEHGFVPCALGELPVGSRLRIFPNHSCATVACFDSYGPEDADPSSRIDARGCFA
jgi:D-serine deaminase-like pyridoxal phosphate-dependent protein